jgi:DegV family protein with EDD domain
LRYSGQYGRKSDIEIIPFAIRVAGSEYIESRTITAQEFYQVQRSAKDIPVTFHIAPGIFYAKFSHAFENGYSCVICATMTSLGSGTYHNAQTGRDWFFERYPDAVGRFEIYILDSKNYSIAYGYGVMRGAAACQSGASVQIVLAAMSSWFDSWKSILPSFLKIRQEFRTHRRGDAPVRPPAVCVPVNQLHLRDDKDGEKSLGRQKRRCVCPCRKICRAQA